MAQRLCKILLDDANRVLQGAILVSSHIARHEAETVCKTAGALWRNNRNLIPIVFPASGANVTTSNPSNIMSTLASSFNPQNTASSLNQNTVSDINPKNVESALNPQNLSQNFTNAASSAASIVTPLVQSFSPLNPFSTKNNPHDLLSAPLVEASKLLAEVLQKRPPPSPYQIRDVLVQISEQIINFNYQVLSIVERSSPQSFYLIISQFRLLLDFSTGAIRISLSGNNVDSALNMIKTLVDVAFQTIQQILESSSINNLIPNFDQMRQSLNSLGQILLTLSTQITDALQLSSPPVVGANMNNNPVQQTFNLLKIAQNLVLEFGIQTQRLIQINSNQYVSQNQQNQILMNNIQEGLSTFIGGVMQQFASFAQPMQQYPEQSHFQQSFPNSDLTNFNNQSLKDQSINSMNQAAQSIMTTAGNTIQPPSQPISESMHNENSSSFQPTAPILPTMEPMLTSDFEKN